MTARLLDGEADGLRAVRCVHGPAAPATFRRWWRTSHWSQRVGWGAFYLPLIGLSLYLVWAFVSHKGPSEALMISGIATTGMGGVFYGVGQALRKQHVAATGYRLCPHCGYALAGLAETGTCPECGTPYDPASLRRDWAAVLDRKI